MARTLRLKSIIRSWLNKRKGKRATRLKEKLKLISEKRSIEDWTMVSMNDGTDENGNFIYYYEYQHKDGRIALEWMNGYSDDPDLKKFLDSQRIENEY